MDNLLQPKHEKDPLRLQWRRRVTIIGLVLALVIGGAAFWVIKYEEPLVQKLKVCDFEQEEVIEMFENYQFKEDEKILMNDYFFYGENFNLFANKYKVGEQDDFVGKTLVLNNLCKEDAFETDEHELFYLLDEDVDGQLPLDKLEPGLYEVFINYNLNKLRVSTEEEIVDKIETLNRTSGKKEISLISSKSIFDDNIHKDYLDDHYLFINVVEKDNDQKVDIIIDPAYGTNVSGFYNDFGVQSENMNQAYELYEVGEMVVNELKKAGLNAELTKSSKDDIKNIYGEEGRLKQAYDSGAKYYVELDWDPYDRKGLKVWHSNYSSQSFARTVATELMKKTGIESPSKHGAFPVELSKGLDASMTIRELGGKALAAGTYSDIAKKENGSFVLNNKYGIHAITINYINSQNSEELNMWKKNKKNYAKATAEGILKYIDMGEADASTDQ